MVIGLKPESEQKYPKYHRGSLARCPRDDTQCNIRNSSILPKDGVLYNYFEYHGSDLAADMTKMAADPTTQE